MESPEWIVLDIDGVLIGIESSYDLAVKRTVEKLWTKLGHDGSISLETIRDFRKKGQFGDDYRVTEGLTLAGLNEDLKKFVEEFPRGEKLECIINRTGERVGKEKVKPIFDRIYLGKKDSPSEYGLWRQEKPLVDTSLLDKVAEQFKLGYITGRSRQELRLASKVLNHELSDAVTREDFLKPDPRALTHLVGESSGIYAGDTHNDGLLVENYNEETEGTFDFVMIDPDNPINQVLRDLLDKK
ncbi:MAG: hydrolase [Candidatus Bipolaricaulota bacterium]